MKLTVEIRRGPGKKPMRVESPLDQGVTLAQLRGLLMAEIALNELPSKLRFHFHVVED